MLSPCRSPPSELSTTSEYGLLGVRDIDFTLDRFPPAPELADLVERHWLVSWALPPGGRHRSRCCRTRA